MEAVSKGAANAMNLGKPAPFDTRSTLLRATQDADMAIIQGITHNGFVDQKKPLMNPILVPKLSLGTRMGSKEVQE